MPRFESCGICCQVSAVMIQGRCKACHDRLRDIGKRIKDALAHCDDCQLDLPIKAFDDAAPGDIAICKKCNSKQERYEERLRDRGIITSTRRSRTDGVCIVCDKRKGLDQFYANAEGKPRTSTCKDCSRELSRLRYQASRTTDKPYRRMQRVTRTGEGKECHKCQMMVAWDDFRFSKQTKDKKAIWCIYCERQNSKDVMARKRQEAAMLVDDLMQRAQFLANASARYERMTEAIRAADALYAAMHEALQDGTPIAYAALKQAEAAWTSARQAIDGAAVAVKQ